MQEHVPEIIRVGAIIRVADARRMRRIRAEAQSFADLRYDGGYVERWRGTSLLLDVEDPLPVNLRQWGEEVFDDVGGDLIGEIAQAFDGVTQRLFDDAPREVVLEWNRDFSHLDAD